MAVICRYCESGSVLHTDGWNAYNALKDHDFYTRLLFIMKIKKMPAQEHIRRLSKELG